MVRVFDQGPCESDEAGDRKRSNALQSYFFQKGMSGDLFGETVREALATFETEWLAR